VYAAVGDEIEELARKVVDVGGGLFSFFSFDRFLPGRVVAALRGVDHAEEEWDW